MKKFLFLLLVLSLWSLVHSPLLAQDAVQMVFEQDVAPDIKATVTIVADPASRNDAQASIKKATEHAKQILDQKDQKDPQDPTIKGCLADAIMEDLNHDGWKDSFLNLGNVFIAKGQDFNGSWRIPVIDKTDSSAQHAFYYKASNVAAATVEQEDNAETDIKSVTVFTEKGACKAERLATTAYGAGLSNAKKILKEGGATRFVLIDQNGNFIQSL